MRRRQEPELHRCPWCQGTKKRLVKNFGTSETHGMPCACTVRDLPVRFQYQEDDKGCVLAAIGMAVNRPYAEIKPYVGMMIDLETEGIDHIEMEDLIAHLGFSWQNRGKTAARLKTLRDPWPCAPWTDTAIATVRNLSNTGAHAVTLLRDGRVLDPWWGVIQGLHRYPEVWQIWGLYSARSGWNPDDAVCADCGRPYGAEHGFPDLVVPHAVWNKHLSPKGNSGGLLCPSCMCKRAHDAGLSNVRARFTSGPFARGSR